jgi:hypothetical protein
VRGSGQAADQLSGTSPHENEVVLNPVLVSFGGDEATRRVIEAVQRAARA